MSIKIRLQEYTTKHDTFVLWNFFTRCGVTRYSGSSTNEANGTRYYVLYDVYNVSDLVARSKLKNVSLSVLNGTRFSHLV